MGQLPPNVPGVSCQCGEKQCRRAPPPNYDNWPSIFWRPFYSNFLVVTLLNNNRRFLVFICMGPFIRPFTAYKALSGPPVHRNRALFLRSPLAGFGGGLRRLSLTVRPSIHKMKSRRLSSLTLSLQAVGGN